MLKCSGLRTDSCGTTRNTSYGSNSGGDGGSSSSSSGSNSSSSSRLVMVA
jgi:hypothetical protein